jgi:hypothetical protein
MTEMLKGQIATVLDHRCPRCGSPLIHDGKREWCTFVGGRDEKACAFGIDMRVPHNPLGPGFVPYANPKWSAP